MLYLTKEEALTLIPLFYNRKVKYSEDRFFLYKKNSYLTLMFIKFGLNETAFTLEEIILYIIMLARRKKISSIYLRSDYDVLLSKNNESFYIYSGHSVNYLQSANFTNFTLIEDLSYIALQNVLKISLSRDLTDLMQELLPNSTHLKIDRILSLNISIVV